MDSIIWGSLISIQVIKKKQPKVLAALPDWATQMRRNGLKPMGIAGKKGAKAPFLIFKVEMVFCTKVKFKNRQKGLILLSYP